MAPLMHEAVEPAPFSRLLPLRALVAERPFALTASADEAAAVARMLDVAAVVDLRIAGSVTPFKKRFRLRGAVEATVTQRCVVTGEPVTADVVAPFDRWLIVGDAPLEADVVDIDPNADDVDYLERAEVDVGVVGAEELALGLEPYPRAPGADGELAAMRSEPADDHPFAALARRRAGS